MNYSRIKKNICDVIKEEQIKLGYRKETIRLYYPLLSLNRFLNTNYDIEEMQTELEKFAASALQEFGDVRISHNKDRFCFYLPEQASEWIYKNTEHSGFLYDFVEAISGHFITIDDILNQFRKYSEHVCFEKVQDKDFDYVIYFEDGEPDDYRYCLTDEQCHFIYHRFTKEDYQDL